MKNLPAPSNRRAFLRSGAAIATASCLPAGAAFALAAPAANPDKPSPVRLGLTSYTFRTLTRAQMIAAMKELRLMRLNCKDIKDHLPMSPPEAEQAALADYVAAKIEVTAVGAVYFKEDTDEAFRRNFEYAKAAKVKIIVAGDPGVAALPRIEKFVKEYDIRIAIHNHGPEDKLWPSPLNVLDAVKDMDPRIGCCIDVGHTMRAGTDVVEAIHKAGPRLFDVHMKDLAQSHVKESQVAVGEGIMPVREIFQALIDIRYPGNVDLEYEIFSDNPIPGVTQSFTYMRGVLAGMGYKA